MSTFIDALIYYLQQERSVSIKNIIFVVALVIVLL